MTTTKHSSLTVNALLAQALRIATPSWIDEHCEIRTFNSLKRCTVAALPDYSLSYQLAICTDSDGDADGNAAVGLIAEIVGPAGQLLAHDSIWGITEPTTYSSQECQAFTQHLAELAADLFKEITDPQHIRQALLTRAREIAAALEAIDA